MRLSLLIFTCFSFLQACNSFSGTDELLISESNSWIGFMDVGNDFIPFRFMLNNKELILINGEEEIKLTAKKGGGDTVIYAFPQYESTLYLTQLSGSVISGYWHYSSKGDYFIPFTANESSNWLCTEFNETLKYKVLFSPEEAKKTTRAIGVFKNGKGSCITGTFLTESGDYRFLQGEKRNNEIWLSCFDGAHLFLFKGLTKGDSIVSGSFLSGNHWSENWVGQIDNSASLGHPDSLTSFNDINNTLVFTAQNLSGDSVQFNLDSYKDKVTIVQIFGSWCPNCYDEMVFYSALNEQISDSRLQIVPVAFERNENLSLAISPIGKFMKHTNAPFEVYFGGKANKKNASEVFPQLSPICSFPTSIFIGKDGRVRKVHTGFYGPGTGQHHELYRAELKRYLTALLNE
jgi:thiol-disulfide isomerase/thioredoxin